MSAAPVVTLPPPIERLNADGLLTSQPDAIATYSGGWITPLNPQVEDIDINDIAHALSNQCRFTGHTKEFYSVAEHCVLCMHIVKHLLKTDKKLAAKYNTKEKVIRLLLTVLMHDGSEAFLSDMARPVKKAEGFGEFYLAAEERLERAIAARYNLIFPYPDVVKLADNMMLASEIYNLFGTEFSSRWPVPEETTPKPRCWTPKVARREYRKAYNSLAS